MSRLTKFVVISVSVLVFCYASIGFVLGQATTPSRPYRSLIVFSEVLQHIQHDYVEDPNMPLVTAGALHGLIEALDPQSSYLSPQEYAEYRRRAANPPKGESGLALSKRFGYVAVVSVLPESPASRAGIRAGDILENISGFTTREMSVGQAHILLTGDLDTSVRVSVLRAGRTEPQEMDIVRKALTAPNLVAEKLSLDTGNSPEAAVAYLRIPSFHTGRAEEVRARLAQLDKQGMRRLVLDLRDSALGEISEGLAAAQLFVEKGTITSLKGQTVERQVFSAEAAKVVWKHAMTVLISNGTAGAAEVLAAALAENGRAKTVGERTFGIASTQRVLPMEDGAALILTVANYYTPTGKAIPAEGVTPQVAVADGPADADEQVKVAVSEDPVVKKALEVLSGAAPKVPAKAASRVPSKSAAALEAA